MTRNKKNTRTMRKRRGITLIETLVLITCVGVMLGLCAVTIQLLLRLHSDSQARISSAMVLDRLARQLRSDAHESQSAQLGAGAAQAALPKGRLTLSLKPAHSITYTAGEHLIDRDETVSGKKVRHETYSLPRDQAAHFELFDMAGRGMVALQLTHHSSISRTEPPRPLEVVAAIGKYPPQSSRRAEGKKP